jgi:uncharacterized protein YcfL
MKKKLFFSVVLLSTLWGCSPTKEVAISDEQAKINRDYTANLQQEDRDRDHIERMRRADAYHHATRNFKTNVIVVPATTVVTPR